MKLLQEGTYVCFTFLVLFEAIACEVSPNTGGTIWTCTCFSDHQFSESAVTASNCSASCDCESPVGSPSYNTWKCACSHGRFPLLAADNNPNCFAACNCISGSSPAVRAPREFISSKAIVFLLSVCVVFALAFVASVICFIRQKEKLKPSAFSSDGGSSQNSGANLISHSHFSFIESKLSFRFTVKPIAGYINKVSHLFKSRSGRIHGTIIQFSYSDLEHATNKFSDSNLIGLGASSHVYRGRLKDGKAVAVKRMKTPSNYDADSMFLTEIELISRLHHCHVVPLIGYCSEAVGRRTERLLVFEFMSNGNLRECLDGSSGKYLDWKTRVSVALGAARGLEYLHDAAAPRILHRDVKSCNILLDENWRPKITDLGMAKHLKTDGLTSFCSSPARMQGTFGYFAPEYAITGKASLKSDVFSFGVVLLELITGRKPIYISDCNREESLVNWAAPRLQVSRQVITELPDPQLQGNFPVEEMQIMAYLAKECLVPDPDTRPSMSEVVQILLTSTLEPDMSKRRNFTINLSQKVSTHNTKDKVDPQRPSRCVEDLNKLSAKARTPRCSIPSEMYRFCTLDDDNIRKGTLSSSKTMRTLIQLSSSGKACHEQLDEDNADLIEPRFETFCMHNEGSC